MKNLSVLTCLIAMFCLCIPCFGYMDLSDYREDSSSKGIITPALGHYYGGYYMYGNNHPNSAKWLVAGDTFETLGYYKIYNTNLDDTYLQFTTIINAPENGTVFLCAEGCGLTDCVNIDTYDTADTNQTFQTVLEYDLRDSILCHGKIESYFRLVHDIADLNDPELGYNSEKYESWWDINDAFNKTKLIHLNVSGTTLDKGVYWLYLNDSITSEFIYGLDVVYSLNPTDSWSGTLSSIIFTDESGTVAYPYFFDVYKGGLYDYFQNTANDSVIQIYIDEPISSKDVYMHYNPSINAEVNEFGGSYADYPSSTKMGYIDGGLASYMTDDNFKDSNNNPFLFYQLYFDARWSPEVYINMITGTTGINPIYCDSEYGYCPRGIPNHFGGVGIKTLLLTNTFYNKINYFEITDMGDDYNSETGTYNKFVSNQSLQVSWGDMYNPITTIWEKYNTSSTSMKFRLGNSSLDAFDNPLEYTLTPPGTNENIIDLRSGNIEYSTLHGIGGLGYENQPNKYDLIYDSYYALNYVSNATMYCNGFTYNVTVPTLFYCKIIDTSYQGGEYEYDYNYFTLEYINWHQFNQSYYSPLLKYASLPIFPINGNSSLSIENITNSSYIDASIIFTPNNPTRTFTNSFTLSGKVTSYLNQQGILTCNLSTGEYIGNLTIPAHNSFTYPESIYAGSYDFTFSYAHANYTDFISRNNFTYGCILSVGINSVTLPQRTIQIEGHELFISNISPISYSNYIDSTIPQTVSILALYNNTFINNYYLNLEFKRCSCYLYQNGVCYKYNLNDCESDTGATNYFLIPIYWVVDWFYGLVGLHGQQVTGYTNSINHTDNIELFGQLNGTCYLQVYAYNITNYSYTSSNIIPFCYRGSTNQSNANNTNTTYTNTSEIVSNLSDQIKTAIIGSSITCYTNFTGNASQVFLKPQCATGSAMYQITSMNGRNPELAGIVLAGLIVFWSFPMLAIIIGIFVIQKTQNTMSGFALMFTLMVFFMLAGFSNLDILNVIVLAGFGLLLWIKSKG